MEKIKPMVDNDSSNMLDLCSARMECLLSERHKLLKEQGLCYSDLVLINRQIIQQAKIITTILDVGSDYI